MKSLLEEKIAFSAQQDSVGKNCAVAAVQIVTKQFDRPCSAQQLETLVTQNNKMTSLYLLKETLEESGLYCVAMETNLESLRRLKNSQIILHLSGSNHYVILDHIDDTDVWTIDLTSRKVYWKTSVEQFLQEWKHGTALIVSDNPQNLNADGAPLSSLVQQQIMGGDPVGSGYSCTQLLQVDDHLFCSEPVGILCGGLYYVYWERYGCQEDPNGGFCTGQEMPGHKYTHCITDFYHFGACTITGVWYPRSIRACQ
jgi:predicted double-glycine peptidase